MTTSRPAAIALVLLIASGGVAGCADASPRSTPTTEKQHVTPAESKSDLDDLYSTIRSTIGADDWQTQQRWLDCSSDAAEATQYSIAGSRSAALDGTPDEVMERVRDALGKYDFDVKVQHIEGGEKAVLAFPNGFNGGTQPDGYAFEIVATDGFAGVGLYGHCVPGDIPDVGSSLNPSPSAS